VALLTVQNITRSGVTPSYTAVAATDTFLPDANTFIHVKNGGASPDSVTISVLQGDPPGLTISDVVVSVTNAQERMIGPLPANFFADPATGLATVAHSFLTTVTSGVFKLIQP
jgi:FlaG/FlaF family flagellin (archaellin)